MDTVIDAEHRFSPANSGKGKSTALDQLRRSPRTTREDAVLLASRLGELAQKLSPEKPKALAKQWFNELWDGDRWAKRKRHILFHGESPPDPIASDGGDWAALITHAAKFMFPDDSPTSIKERTRVERDLLRGTSFLPAANLVPLRSDDAQSLMSVVAATIEDAIGAKTELVQLWEALDQTPFGIESYNLEKPAYSEEQLQNPIIAEIARNCRYDGDALYRAPLNTAARLASEVSKLRYRQFDGRDYRFETGSAPGYGEWSYPILRLGLLGHRRNGRIFVIPENFIDELPFDQAFDDGEVALEVRVLEWLISKGILPNNEWPTLPEVTYTEASGFGWQRFSFDVPRQVWVEVRPRANNAPGLWFSASVPDYAYCYPSIPSIDTLPIEARRSRKAWLRFLPMTVEDTMYEFLQWPMDDPDFLIESHLPVGASSGLLDAQYCDFPDIEGWLDDRDNAELQELLFRLPPNTRFCPSIAVDDELPPPCPQGTIAAAIFANAGTDSGDRLAQQLINQAEIIATNGLSFYAALLSTHRARIDAMLSE